MSVVLVAILALLLGFVLGCITGYIGAGVVIGRKAMTHDLIHTKPGKWEWVQHSPPQRK